MARAGDPAAGRRPAEAADRKLEALLARSGEAHREGRLDAAQRLCRQALGRDRNNAAAWERLGLVQIGLGELDRAEASLAKALELAPARPQAHVNLGLVMHRAGRPEEALEHYRQALALRPGDSAALFNIAQLMQRLGRLEEAVAYYRQVIDKEPWNGPAWHGLGTALEEQSQPAEAWQAYLRAGAVRETRGRAENNLRVLNRFWPRPQIDLANARKALAAAPESGRAAVALAVAEWQAGEVDGAVERLHRLLGRDAASAAALRTLGLVEAARGNDAAARHALDRALTLDPADVAARAGRLSLESAAGDGQRVALHLSQDYHFAILKPVFDALAGRQPVLFSPHTHVVAAFEPDVVVVAESQSAILRHVMPRARFVWTRHGLISKTTSGFSARVADYACLTSDASRAWYEANGARPRRGFWITGYPQLDPLFRAEAAAAAPPAADGRVVLYAPTWTPDLSSAEMLGGELARLIRGDRRDLTIVIKPHPVTGEHRPGWIERWRAVSAREPDVELVDDPRADLVPLLARADALVSDASSAIFQFLATDRPIVLLTNPAHRGSAHYDPNGIEWRWRDVGAEVRDVKHLAAAVARALDRPDRGAERRAHYRRELFGELTDGRAGERIAAHIRRLSA